MCFFFSFFPATFWLVLGYFVLFSSTKAEGNVRSFGRILAIWIFVIAAFIPMMAAYITLNDLCPLTAFFEGMHSTASQ